MLREFDCNALRTLVDELVFVLDLQFFKVRPLRNFRWRWYMQGELGYDKEVLHQGMNEAGKLTPLNMVIVKRDRDSVRRLYFSSLRDACWDDDASAIWFLRSRLADPETMSYSL